MFSAEEKEIIMQDYFQIYNVTESLVEFRSQSHDWWMILEVEVKLTRRQLAAGVLHRRTYMLYHKHSDAEAYHEQGEYASVLDAILEVINHDDYRLHNKGRTHFDELLEWVRIRNTLQTI